jgi:hypothetical protein
MQERIALRNDNALGQGRERNREWIHVHSCRDRYVAAGNVIGGYVYRGPINRKSMIAVLRDGFFRAPRLITASPRDERDP